MNYFDGNYTGFVKVMPKPDMAATVQQIALSYPALAPTLSSLVNQNGEMANIELDCSQTGWGITPIIGVDLVWKGITLAMVKQVFCQFLSHTFGQCSDEHSFTTMAAG